MNRYLTIDKEGYFATDGQRISDSDLGGRWLGHLQVNENFQVVQTADNEPVFIEAFDAPLIALHVHKVDQETGEMDLPYQQKARFAWATLCTDEWDRFHGLSENKIPFVFSRQAQMEFFDLLDDFDDESITIGGKRIAVGSWLAPVKDVTNPNYWTELYQSQQSGWDLGQVNPILPAVLPQLKLNRSSILVLGCGAGHDAAYLAKAGHLVTALDFSSEALARARKEYSSVEGLTFVQADALTLDESWNERFSMVFEHTCYCAISPDRRNDLVKVWRRTLLPRGHLLGIFFAMEKREGPPFGGSEWEMRERLHRGFDFLYWTRWRQSVERRKGKELVIYARKKD